MACKTSDVDTPPVKMMWTEETNNFGLNNNNKPRQKGIKAKEWLKSKEKSVCTEKKKAKEREREGKEKETEIVNGMDMEKRN